MNLATFLLLIATFTTRAEATPAQLVGRGRNIPEDSAENDIMEKLMAGARNISPETGRRLSSPLDKVRNCFLGIYLGRMQANWELTLSPFELCSWRS